MNHLALITKTTALIEAGDIVGAESALAELADAEGDKALMVVLDQLPAKDLLAVMREYDDSKASVVNLLVTPEQFLTAIGDLEGGSEALANYFEEKWSRIEAFARTGHFDTVEDDGAMLSDDALLGSLYVRPHIDQDEVADRDWMQLAWLLRYECRDLFIETLLVLRAKARAYNAGLGEGDEVEDDDEVKFETSETDRGKATPAARTSDDEESAI